MTEVVYATAGDLAKLPFSGLSEGFYVVGSGNTGVGTGLMALGAIYGAAVMGSAMVIKVLKICFTGNNLSSYLFL